MHYIRMTDVELFRTTARFQSVFLQVGTGRAIGDDGLAASKPLQEGNSLSSNYTHISTDLPKYDDRRLRRFGLVKLS